MEDDDTKTCPYCLSEIPGVASRCRHCTSELYAPVDGDTRGWWIVGFLLAVVGIGIVAGSSNGEGDWAFVLVGIGGVLLQVGAIATGVSVGMRDARGQTFEHRRAIANRFTGEEGW